MVVLKRLKGFNRSLDWRRGRGGFVVVESRPSNVIGNDLGVEDGNGGGWGMSDKRCVVVSLRKFVH